MEYDLHGYEDLPSADLLFAAASSESLGKRPKATQWYQDFKSIAIQTHFMVAVSDLKRRYHRVHTTVPKRRVIHVEFK